jgi:Dolichyl-phosphate-mannose-protein mannosyltransferase
MPETDMANLASRLGEPSKNAGLLPGRAIRILFAFAALYALVVLLQRFGGAYASEFGGYPDEAAHYITGLMIHDYVAAGMPQAPVAYAENYYFHYPKVAFGMWGPLLHVSEAAWMFVFSPSRASILLLIGLITALTATLLYAAITAEFGSVAGIVGAILFVAAGPVQKFTGMIMADGLVGLFDLCAAFAFGRFLDTKRLKYSVWFGVFTCLSILTKGNGVALVLIPAFGILFTRQYSLLKDKSLWLAAVIILVFAGPWQYYSDSKLLGILAPGARKPPGSFVLFYATAFVNLLGIFATALAGLGFYSRIIRPFKERAVSGAWAALAALMFAVLGFHIAFNGTGGEARYLIAVVPPLIMFLMAGVAFLVDRSRLLALRGRQLILLSIVMVMFVTTVFSLRHKEYHGFDEVASTLEAPEFQRSVVLVSSEDDNEGTFIAEIAMRDIRPSHVILRATKMLSQSDWLGRAYRLQFTTPAQVQQFLHDTPVNVIVIDNEQGDKSYPHQALLKQTVAAFPEEWEHLGAFPQRRRSDSGATIDVYRNRSALKVPGRKIRVPMPYTLGHSIER